MKVRVNYDACIGCGACSSIANNVFEMNEEGLAQTILKPNKEAKDSFVIVSEDDEEEARDASEGCPTSAIEIIEEAK